MSGTGVPRTLADGRTLLGVTAPGAPPLEALVPWLDAGCPDPAPVRTGFAVALVEPGRTIAASGARSEIAWLWCTTPTGIELALTPHRLLDLQGAPELDEQHVGEYLFTYLPPDATVYRGIHRVPAGHVLEARPGNTPWLRRWFHPMDVEAAPRTIDAGAAMRAVVRDAVAASIPERGEVVAQLSGGLDSTMVTATAAALLRPQHRRLRAASHLAQPWPAWLDPEADDAPAVQAFLAGVPGVEGHTLTNDGRSPLESLRHMISRAAHPFLNPSNAPWLLAIEQWAAACGAGVMLTGTHGSVGFSLTRHHQYRRALAHARLGLVARDAAARVQGGDTPRYVAHDLAMDLAPRAVVRARSRRQPAAPRGYALREEARPPGVRRTTRRDARWWREVLLIDLHMMGLLQPVGGTPWVSDPLGDPEVLRLLMSLPPDAWLGSGRGREVARSAMRGLVPDDVRLRTGRGLQGIDIADAVAAHQGDYRAALEQVEASPLAARYIDLPALRASMSPHVPTHSRVGELWQVHEGRTLGFGLFLVWFERYLAGRHG